MKKFVTYVVMLAYLTVTLYPHRVQAQQYEDEYEAAPQQQYQQQPAPTPQPAQQFQSGGKPKVAVYVSDGYSGAEQSALRTTTLNALVRSGRYNVIERSDIIEAELQKQASGAVDDDQLTAFGRQAGAQYICISDMIFLRNRVEEVVIGYYDNGSPKIRHDRKKDHQVSVRMIDVETAEVLAFSLITASITDGKEMVTAIAAAVDRMLATVQPAKAANMPKMAVYVTGSEGMMGRGRDQKQSALYSYTLEALFQRSRNLGTFKVIERADAFTRQIDREQGTQRSGHIADDQIARLGKQYGIERILVASMERAMGNYNISARIINIETASVENASRIAVTDSDLKGLERIPVSMVEEMMGLTKEESNKRATEAAERAEAARKASVRGTIWTIVFVVGVVGLLVWLGAENKKNTETQSVR